MGRRSKLENMAIGVLIIVGAAITAIVKLFEKVGFVIPAVILTITLIIYLWSKSDKAKRTKLEAEKRCRYLMAKYGDKETVNNIINKAIWVGQTEEQLRESLGAPEDIDQKVLKTKKKEVWKYGHKGGNRYMYRITLDDDEVVGWDEKA